MIQFPKKEQVEEPGRNDLCTCGSGKKYKKCCLKKKQFLEKKVDVTTMLKLLYCLVRGLKKPKDPTLIITKRTVDERMPENWMEEMTISTGMTGDGKECYLIFIKPEEEPLIVTPDKAIVTTPGKRIFR